MGKKNTTDDTKVMRYKQMYERGLITKEQLLKLVQKGILTEEQYQEIVGVDEVQVVENEG